MASLISAEPATQRREETTFQNLPTELRHMVWKMALEDEAKVRLIVVNGIDESLANKMLLSPFLSVSYGSRGGAGAFLDT
ncbi:hypothetical protein DL769_000869 [Monosporascus sp. CRB-8-3]|nr:hypothetical protein DL769_000869 [Monosporascus sp. CRB-8-3]